MTDGTGEPTRKVATPGSSFGPYTIIESLGAGGMGEVFRARDAKLNRHVALKFLPEELSSDEQLLARFQREAKLLALVNHPNIATIHSIEEDYEHPFLVLELVEGETLSTILKSGPLPLREALRVCRDIAAALEAAHRKGIVHRDLKPANVMVTGEGMVKVLDFGIAKPVRFGEAASDLEQTPSEELTVTGTILGTGPYMSPEQVRGKTAGRRADIWGFGCLMYQTLTGKVAFGRDTLADTLTSILEREPDWSRLPAKTPESIRRLLKRCVQKDPAQRLQAIGDARIEIEEAIRTPSSASPRAGAAGPARWQLVAGAAAMLTIGVFIGALAVLLSGPSGGRPEPGFYDFAFPSNVVLGLGRAPSIAISRDGSRFVAVFHDGSSRRVYRRDLNSSTGWTQIPGTEGAEGPFFSWDGDNIGFFAHSGLHWAPYDGSNPPEELVEAPEPFGGAWAPDGTIYFSSNQSLWTTRINTRASELLLRFDPAKRELGLRWPSILPDGETLLYTSWAGSGSADSSLNLRRSTGDRSLLLRDAGYARYSPSGHLVFARDDELFAIPFDPNSLTITGDELLQSTFVLVRADIGVPFFALAAQSGTLVHAPGGLLTPGPVLAWMDATGRSVPEPLVLGTYHEALRYPRLSADGRELIVTIEQGGGSEDAAGSAYAAIVDLDESGNTEEIVAGVTTYAPEWSPDGGALAYLSYDDLEIYAKAAHATGYGTRLTQADPDTVVYTVPTAWSATGLLFYNHQPISADTLTLTSEVRYIDANGRGGAPQSFRDGGYDAYGAVPSPDGSLVAWVRRQGEEETSVWVTPFPDGTPRRVVSEGTDCQEPTWSAEGSRLFFRCDSQMWVADIQTTPLNATNRRILWDWPFALDAQLAKANYAYDPVRERFLMVSEEPIVTASGLRVVEDWHQRLLAGARR